LVGLVAVRITWITATVVCVVSILIGLLAGTDGGGSSPGFPGFGFSDGGDSSQQPPEFASFEPAAAIFGAENQQNAQRTKIGAAQENRSVRTNEGAPGEGHFRSGVPRGSGSHPEGADRRKPVVTSSPKPPQAPSAKPPQAPSVKPPKLPPAPSVKPPKLPPAPSVKPPKLPPAPSVTPPELPKAASEIPVPSPPPVSLKVSAPVQTPVTVPKISVGLP
jgi:hypothetical protein